MAKWKHDEERDLICEQLERGEISYSSLPRNWKRDRGIVSRSKFEDVLKDAPNGYWKNKDFIKAVLTILKKESTIEGFNESHYIDFVKKIKKYNYSDSKIWYVVISDFSNYKEHSEFLLNLINLEY